MLLFSPSSSPRWFVLAGALVVVSALDGATAHAQAQPEAPPPVEAPPLPPPPPPPPAAEEEPPLPPLPPSEEAPAIPRAPSSARLDELDERIRIVDRKIELIEEAAAAKKDPVPSITAGESGFALKSANGSFTLKLRGLVQADGRQYLHDRSPDKALELKDTFLVRKARPILDATFNDVVDLRIMPDFGNGQSVLMDAYVELRPLKWIGLRAGKMKPGLVLERAQSDQSVVFPERAFPASLGPSREVGFELVGSLASGSVLYEAGLFNGALDNSTEDLDNNFAKDWLGRLFLQPWKPITDSPLANLGVGIGGSIGNERGVPAVVGARPVASTPALASYRTAGQQTTVFRYLVNDTVADGTVIAKGRRVRWSPQGYYYFGPAGVLAEWIKSSQRVQKGAQAATLSHQAWQVAGYFVLGGKPRFDGVIVDDAFDLKKRTWGALELAVRYSVLDLDDDAFPIYADPTSSSTKASALAGVLNWHWSRNVRISFSYERTAFDGGAKTGDRPTEHVLFERIQAVF